MSQEKSKIKLINHKKESREIAKRIIEFGVTEDQKIEVMMNLALTLEDNKNMSEIVNFLKKYTVNFNTDEKENKINNVDKNKILLN
jgi:hypothetical protein